MPETGSAAPIQEPCFFSLLKSSDKSIQCNLCPNNCVIAPGKFGICGVRGNSAEGRKGIIPFAGKLSALAIDPIEKKPLYHFYPGSKILSAGFYGCSLRCPYCQNYTISTRTDTSAETVSPSEAVKITENSGTIGLAYTYSEPLVHIEWVMETAALLRKKNLKNVLVTNGYINPEAGKAVLENMDALNIDLKSFNEDFYKTEVKGKLAPVKEFIRQAAAITHVEVTTLVIPGKNDSRKEIEEIASFLASIKKSIPLHLSCYHPSYNYTTEPTKPETVISLAAAASKHLEYVYTGNTGMMDSDTKCPSCGATIINRSKYSLRLSNVSGLDNNQCMKCGRKIEIIT
ncbi:MAG: AmmeMemoRadiSam system radical SAM enzyme [Spirochaetia bacterium]|nr:AmmeMemoRadiSam system radical SAM enzyme [Spirochaetia bacterium]